MTIEICRKCYKKSEGVTKSCWGRRKDFSESFNSVNKHQTQKSDTLKFDF